MKNIWLRLITPFFLILGFGFIPSHLYGAGFRPGLPGSVAQLAELTSSDGTSEDSFGTSIATSGDTVVVGAPFHSAIGSSGRGAAYVFVKPVTGWTNMTETAELTASDGVELDTFGFAVAIDGNVIVVGDYSHPATSNYLGPGAVYVFVKPSGGWKNMTETSKLTATDGELEDEFGASVSIAENTILIGATCHPYVMSCGPGAAYIFASGMPIPRGVAQVAELTASDGQDRDFFGTSARIADSTIVVGAPHASGLATDVGASYVFVEPATGWTNMIQTAKLTASNASSDLPVEFGAGVAIDGSTVLVGAPYQAVGTDRIQGAAYMFVEPVGGWADVHETAELTTQPLQTQSATTFGFGLDLNGDLALIGAYGLNQNKGQAYGYIKPLEGWKTTETPNAALKASDGRSNDFFGSSVAIGTKIAIIGAFNHAVNGHPLQGAAYVFGQK